MPKKLCENSAKREHADIEECAKIWESEKLAENVHLCISLREMPKKSHCDAKNSYKNYASRNAP